MPYVCTYCHGQSADGNLTCQLPQCSLNQRVETLPRGAFVADVEILELIKITRTSTLYVGKRSEKKLFLKLSHPDVVRQSRNPNTTLCDDGFSQILKNEAALMREVSGLNSTLPTWISPQSDTANPSNAYGKITLGEQLRYFVLMEYVEGVLLSNYLADYKQPYPQHAGWIVAAIAQALTRLKNQNSSYQHLGLHPDHIWLRMDEKGIPRPLLLDLGVGAVYHTYVTRQKEINSCAYSESMWRHLAPSTARDFNPALAWLSVMVEPAYTSPRLVASTKKAFDGGEAADVDNLKLILRQMLNGEAPYNYPTLTDDQIYSAVRGGLDDTLRSDLRDPQYVMGLTKRDNNAFSTLNAFYDACVNESAFGPIEMEYVSRTMPQRAADWINSQQGTRFLWGVFVVLCVIFAVGVLITLVQPPTLAT